MAPEAIDIQSTPSTRSSANNTSSTVSRSPNQSHSTSTTMNNSSNNNNLNIPTAQTTPRRSSSAMEHYSDLEYLRSPSRASDAYLSPGSVSRSGTLKKRASMRQAGSPGAGAGAGGNSSLKRMGSTKSVPRAGGGLDRDTFYSAFYTPVPTSGSPTDRLVDRFSGMYSEVPYVYN